MAKRDDDNATLYICIPAMITMVNVLDTTNDSSFDAANNKNLKEIQLLIRK